MVDRSRYGGKVGGGFSVTMDPGGASLLRGMERWADLLDDPSEAWPHVTRLVHRHNKRTFESEGAATGGGPRWGPLRPSTIAYKARWFPGQPTLVRTAALRSALTSAGSGSRVVQRKRSLEVGARGDVARIGGYHQTGTPNMIARPPVKFDPRIQRGTLPFAVSQILQTLIVAKRRAALGADAGVMDASAIEKRAGSMDKLSRTRTR